MYFDTHAHYDDSAFDEDRVQLLRSLHDRGVELIINPGCDLESSRAAIALAEEFDFVYAAVVKHCSALPYGARAKILSILMACRPVSCYTVFIYL